MRNNQPASQQFFASPSFSFQKDTHLYFSPVFQSCRKPSVGQDDLFGFKLEDEVLHLNQDIIQQEVRQNSEQQNNYQEAGSQLNTLKCQVLSTHLFPVRQDSQISPLELVPSKQTGNIRQMIQFLVNHSNIDEERLRAQGRRFGQKGTLVRKIYNILIPKFSKLKKTKQQMTKYCMRKAFKFVGQLWKTGLQNKNDLDKSMKQYFAQNDNIDFSIPFKKHSQQKTMNLSFLKRVFSSSRFSEDYQIFIKKLPSIIAEDNYKKINYLLNAIMNTIETNQIKNIERMKRIPWTKKVLDQVMHLAIEISNVNANNIQEKIKRNKKN